MSQSQIARRYAQAMLELCDEHKDHKAVRVDFDRLCATLGQEPSIGAFFADPSIAESKRAEVLASLLDKLKVKGNVANLARLMLEKGRFAAIEAVHERFQSMIDRRTGRVVATVTSATEIKKPAQQRLHKILEDLLKKKVDMQVSIDESLIGGLVVTIGNTAYDASVRNHLGRLRERLMSGYRH